MTGDELRRWVRKRKERLERALARDGRTETFRELDDYGLWLIRHRQIELDDLRRRTTRVHMHPSRSDRG